MAIADKIKALQEAADKLAEAKAVNSKDFNNKFDKDQDNEVYNDNDTDAIDDEDETVSKKKDAVKEDIDPMATAASKQKVKIAGVEGANKKVATTRLHPGNGDRKVMEAIDLGTLFDGTDLTEEFKEKAQTIFESAVAVRVAQEVELMENELALRALTESEELKEGLVEKVDGYLDYMVEQWIKDNEVALERGIKAEIFESFVSSMHSVFLEHNISLPDEEFDLVESTLEKTEQLQGQLDESIAQNVELNKTIKQYAKDALIKEHSEGMTNIDAEKFALLAEEINFDDDTSFAKKLDTIRENYVSKGNTKETKELTEDITQGSNDPVDQVNESTVKKTDSTMNQYLKAFN